MNASRIANSVRAVLPYASWAGYAIQLGYLGYTAYQAYQAYVIQCETDARNGCNRSLNDTIELVIKPRRKKLAQQQQNSTNDSSSATTMAPPPAPEGSDEQGLLQNTNNVNSPDSEELINTKTDPRVTNREELHPFLGEGLIDSEKPSSSDRWEEGQSISGKSGCAIDENEVTCVYDSRSNQENNDPLVTIPGVDADETCSNASTSLESTDSNKGIVNDIYSECFICARSLNDPGKAVATLPFCMHPFHQTCLDGVLKWHPKCPVCDFNIFSPI